jgi:hypothetical protein
MPSQCLYPVGRQSRHFLSTRAISLGLMAFPLLFCRNLQSISLPGLRYFVALAALSIDLQTRVALKCCLAW